MTRQPCNLRRVLSSVVVFSEKDEGDVGRDDEMSMLPLTSYAYFNLTMGLRT